MKKIVLLTTLFFTTLFIKAQDINFQSEYNRIYWPINSSIPYGGGIIGDDGNYKRLALFHGHSIDLQTGSNSPNSNNSRLYINSIGNVGIGTKDTKGFKLGVKGKIAAEEVKVAGYSQWPDFVFYSSYSLPSLKDVEYYIKEKGHLKDIPSAKEVIKNGIYLGDMDAKLLRKIEELTLYTIEQEKQIKAQNSEIEKISKENIELKSISRRLAKIEEMLAIKNN